VPSDREPGPQKGGRAIGWTLLLALLTVLLLFPLVLVRGIDGAAVFEVSYTRFKELLNRNQVAELILSGDDVQGRLKEPLAIGPQGRKGERFRTRIPAVGDDSLLPALEARGVEVRVLPPAKETNWFPILLMSLPLLFLVALVLRSVRAWRNLAGGIASEGESRFLKRGQVVEVPKVRFGDVAGQENAKREVTELVDFLREPARFRKLGAEVPRGVLLMGPPGTGKTLLARALAGEAGVPFLAVSASEFIEVFVGVGASRVRQLFEVAKKNAPSILFLDELDSVGRTRGTGLGGGHDEREQTLNQILAEMDGFAEHEAVIVLAATNRPDVLDPALLRPGRFDRHVVLDLPDRRDREAILRVHCRKVPLDPDVDLGLLSGGTAGFSGADLKNLVNEAALLAAREGCLAVAASHFESARDKVLLGTERTLAIGDAEKHRLAVHESGHAAVAYFVEHADPLYKVSIIPRGRTLGGTQQVLEEERHTLPEEYLQDRLATMLGGRAAEKELLSSVSSGADDDIRQATALARAMVARWGMSEAIGPVDLRDSEEHPFLGREIAQPRRFSESSARLVDSAVRDLLLSAEGRAIDVLRVHRSGLEELVARLEREETLYRADIEDCLEKPSLSRRGIAG
jgi:cell division protease FtsH